MNIRLTDYWRNVAAGLIEDHDFLHISSVFDATTTLKSAWNVYIYPLGTK
jgi:hypothetical protein